MRIIFSRQYYGCVYQCPIETMVLSPCYDPDLGSLYFMQGAIATGSITSSQRKCFEYAETT
jgi:hypothetical protein